MYRLRGEIEHGFSTLKLHFGLEEFHVRGKQAVKVHVFLSLMLRVAYAIASYKMNSSATAERPYRSYRWRDKEFRVGLHVSSRVQMANDIIG